jgi:aspartate kinase
MIVQKFGGTSMGSVEKITNVAHKVIKEIELGHKVVVVASAMSGETNRMVALFNEAIGEYHRTEDLLAEYDSIVSTGEQVSCALLAVVLTKLGYKARSLTGWQVGFETSGMHSSASIENIKTDTIARLLEEGIIPVITGFQGIMPKTGRQSTIGRGGSDTSAIAIAAALKAKRCDIYTDVDGVYTSDPRLVKTARKLNYVGHEEMIEMAASGAKVLEPRSVMLAMMYNLDVQVLSSFEENPKGTILTNDDNIMERRIITSVTSNKQDIEITVKGLPNAIDTASKLFEVLANASITVDMIIHEPRMAGDSINIAFTITAADIPQTKTVLDQSKSYLKYDSYEVREDVAKVSVIGVGMKVHSGIAHTMFSELARNNIKPLAISTSEIKISILVEQKYEELAVRSLHDVFNLGKKS